MSTLLSFDVATKYTGFAVFSVQGDWATLVQHGILYGGPGTVQMRGIRIARMCGFLMNRAIPNVTTLIEFPSFHGQGKGLSAARGGDTLQLARVCGMIEGQECGIPITITYTEWNGQLPKQITCARLKQHMGIEANPSTIDNNYADAIMMGRWWWLSVGRKVREGRITSQKVYASDASQIPPIPS